MCQNVHSFRLIQPIFHRRTTKFHAHENFKTLQTHPFDVHILVKFREILNKINIMETRGMLKHHKTKQENPSEFWYLSNGEILPYTAI